MESIRSLLKSESTESSASKKKNSTSNSSKKLSQEETKQKKEAEARYKHDIEQAMAMKARASRQRKTTTPAAEQLSRDVELALQGLDQADGYKADGTKLALEQAMKLYSLGLELLLKVLREASSEDLVAVGIDKTSLEARVHVALSDAETVKSSLNNTNLRQQHQQQHQPSHQSSAEEEEEEVETVPAYNSTFQSISNSLTSALQRTATTINTRTNASTPNKQQQHRPRATIAAAAAPKQQSPQRPTNTNSQQQSSQSNTNTLTPNDQLRQVILDDFYVDPQNTTTRTTWNDICGLDNVKQSLQETAILPLLRPDLFSGLRKQQNILLYGPPGTGKTMLVRAVAQESACSLFVVTAGTLTSKWMGESEKLVRALFQMARDPRVAPSIIFIDEVDSLLSKRKSDGEHEASRRLKTEVMVNMDGINSSQEEKTVLVLACTNCPWDIDAAVLRRFPRRIYVPLPDPSARRGLFKSLLKKAGKHSLTSRQIATLVQRTEGFSGSDISSIASEASFGPLRSVGGLDAIRRVQAKDVRPMSMQDFEEALRQASKSVTSDHLRRYEEWKQQTST